MTDSKICRRSLPAKDATSLGEPLRPQQPVDRAKTVARTEFEPPIDGNFAQMCAQDLPFDVGEAITFMKLLDRDPWGSGVHIRAIPRKGLVHPAINGNLKKDHERFSALQAQQKGIYVVVNPGGRKQEHITSCVALFVEWDDIPLAAQFARPSELGLPDPTFRVSSGDRSIHTYWVLTNPIEPARWLPLMDRLIRHLESDANCVGANRCMRLPGGWHIDKIGMVGERTSIIDITDQKYPVELFEELLPELPPSPIRDLSRKVYSGSDASLTEIAEALSCIPSRVAGQGDYSMHRNIAWAVKAACDSAGYDESKAIGLLEIWSPSSECGWNVTQVVRSGGDHITAGTLFHHAKQYGYKHHE